MAAPSKIKTRHPNINKYMPSCRALVILCFSLSSLRKVLWEKPRLAPCIYGICAMGNSSTGVRLPSFTAYAHMP